MVIDTSALIAILLGEPEADALAHAVADEPKRMLSAFSALEAYIVITAKKGESGGRELDLLVHRCQVETIGLNADQSKWHARRGWPMAKDVTPPDSISATVAHTRWRSIQANLFCS